MKIINIVRIAGKLVTVNAAGVGQLLTVNKTASGDYETLHDVHFTKAQMKADAKPEIKPGKRLDLVGSLNQNPGEFEVFVDVTTVALAKKGDPDINVAKVVANAARSITYYPRTNDKSAFGNILLTDNDGHFFRGVAFQETAYRLKYGDRDGAPLKRGALVQLVGQIRKREYNGKVGTEIAVASGYEDDTIVLRGAVASDPFAGVPGAETPAHLLTGESKDGTVDTPDGPAPDVF